MNLGSHRLWLACCALAAAHLALAEPAVVEYKAAVKGSGDRAVVKSIKEMVPTFTLINRPPATIGQLQRRVDKDLSLIEAILQSRGYHDGKVVAGIDADKDPVTVLFVIDPGRQYSFGRVDLGFQNNDDPELKKITSRLRVDGQAIASRVFDDEQRILELMQSKGYPFPQLARRDVELDRVRKQVNLAIDFDAGLRATYGQLEVHGLESLGTNYIQRQLPWKRGEKYDTKLISTFEDKLLSSGIFATARVEPRPPQNASNSIPVKITVTERDLRTIRLGIGYSDVGANAKAAWEHRNLFGHGESLKTSATYSPIEWLGSAKLERPGFFGSNQSLILGVDLTHENPDAYDADTVADSALVKRAFNRHITGGTGLRYKYSKIKQLLETDEYNHLIFPVLLDFDYRNDKLNPVKGGQLFFSPSVYQELNARDSFLKTDVEARLYKMLWERPRLSAAARLKLGSIAGSSVDNIAADERYYAGGGVSIRGYEYQSVGPQLDGNPLGATELLEFSLELRLHPGNQLGYVAFVDGGAAYNNWAADADQQLRYGAGLGMRWFTGIGPLRVDLAYPLNAEDHHVKRLQFYISLGQAF